MNDPAGLDHSREGEVLAVDCGGIGDTPHQEVEVWAGPCPASPTGP